ncbi:MAG: hypothetical protein CME25_16795 [Gemmatimonadetes bacterium]|nr:hypothetical protein [Gemmatimonadota bacterium]
MLGLSFTNPALLHGLWAGLLPLLIHLLNRRRTVSVPFSNVALLQTLQQDRMKKVKLKQILLLIIRSLILLLLALAFSGPTVKGTRSDGTAGARTSAVLLLDRSLSMRHRLNGGTLFDRARERTREALGLFDSRDDVSLHLFDDRTEPFNSRSVEHVQSRLEIAQPSYRSTNLGPVLVQAFRQLGSSALVNRELYIISDMARGGWLSVPESLPAVSGLSIFVVPTRPKKVRNLGVLAASPLGQVLSVGRSATLEVELVNYGPDPGFEIPVEVYMDGRRIAQELLYLEPETNKKWHSRFTPERGGQVPVVLQLGEDDFEPDNSLTAVLAVPDQIRVLVLGETTGDTYYIEQALATSQDHGDQIIVHRAKPEELNQSLLANVDVVVLCNVSRLRRGQIDVLLRKIKRGTGLLVTLGEQIDIRHYNSELLPALMPTKLISVVGNPDQMRTYHSLERPLPVHPVFQNARPQKTFKGPRFYAYYRVQVTESLSTIVSFNSGSAAVLEARIEDGRTLMLTSSLGQDLSWTDLPVTGLFIPFLHQVIRYLAMETFGKSNYVVGETVSREITGIRAREALLKPPSGEPRTIWPEQRGANPVWPVGDLNEPGIWEIYANERLADMFAVHLPEEEVALTPVARIEGHFEDADVFTVAEETKLSDAVLETRMGKELWRPVLGMVFVLLAVEMLLARSTRTAMAGA